jgi:hypothetical protein
LWSESWIIKACFDKQAARRKHEMEQNGAKISWKTFKEMCEKAGIRDEDEIDSIDISWGSLKYFKANKDEDFGWQIYLGEY